MNDDIELRTGETPTNRLAGIAQQSAKSGSKVIARTLIGSIPILGDLLLESYDEYEAVQDERRMSYVEECLSAVSSDVDEFKRLLSSDAGIRELFLRGFKLSSDARSAAKIRLLATVVVESIEGKQNNANLGQFMLTVVESLEPVHLDALVQIEKLQSPQPTGDEREATRMGTTPDALALHLGFDRDVIEIVIEDLDSRRFIRNIWEGTWNGMDRDNAAYAPTLLGKEAVRLLSEIHLEDDSAS